MISKTHNKLVWIDLEMTGLDIDTCHILEMALVITDSKFNILAEKGGLVIYQPPIVLDNMSPWCLNIHQRNGLIAMSQASKLELVQAENIALKFLEEHNVMRRASPLCGNCVWQDRKFLKKFMPALESHFTHQHLDLATMRLLAQLEPAAFEFYKPVGNHLALEDIKDHIAEFNYLLGKLSCLKPAISV